MGLIGVSRSLSAVTQGYGSYQRLDPVAVHDTVSRLRDRIAARFPDRNLRLVAAQLGAAVEELLIQPRSPWYATLRIASRTAMVALFAILLVGLVMLFRTSARTTGPESVWDWAQIAESGINDVVFAGIAMYFFWQLPERVKRRHDLAALYTLRSLAHVIDMHQLTKDPERLRTDFRATEQTMRLTLTAAELGNYLDYCSELLSLVSKTAALFAQGTSDPAVLATVQGIEDLTNGMSRKIWQKIALLPRADQEPLLRPGS